MKYELIIENNIKKLNLKKVRIKVDPSLIFQAEDLSQCDGYEGYILAETGDVPKVLVMSPDGASSVMDIPQQFLQMLMSDEESEALRSFKEYICNICELDTTTPEAEILLNAPTIEEIEAILKTVGLTDDELKVLYRNFIADNESVVSEGVFGSLLNKATSIASTTAKGAGAALKGAGSVYGALIGTKGGAALQKAGAGLQKMSKMSDVKNLQLKKAIPYTGDYISFLAPPLNKVTRFKVTNVAAGTKGGIDITAKPREKVSNAFDRIVIKTSGDTGLQSGIANVIFMQKNALSTIKPISVNTGRTDINGVSTWQLNLAKNKASLKKTSAEKKTPAKGETSAGKKSTLKPTAGEKFTLGKQKYIWGGTSWAYPSKTDPNTAGAYVTDTLLKKQITDAWTKYKTS